MSPQPGLQRCHWYANEVGLFVQEPGETVNVWPCCAVPAIVGTAVFAGGAGGGCTVPVAAESALAEPCAFVAVTRTFTVAPTSVPVRTYVCAAAPAMFPQAGLQRCHW